MKRQNFVQTRTVKEVVTAVVVAIFFIVVIIVVATNSGDKDLEMMPNVPREEKVVNEPMVEKELITAEITTSDESATNTSVVNTETIAEINPETSSQEANEAVDSQVDTVTSAYNFSTREIILLQKIVFAEAASESIECQIGVAAVILNRLNSEYFPDTLEEVIFQEGQFSPAIDGDIYFADWKDQYDYEYRPVEKTDITGSVKEAVRRALEGENPIGDRIGFYAPMWCSEEELAYRENIQDKLTIDTLVFHGAW